MSLSAVAPSAAQVRRLSAEARSRYPRPSWPMAGRQDLVTCYRRLVREDPSAPVTLIGIGGVGKTRLALELVERTVHSGVPAWFVALDRLPVGSAIEAALSEALPDAGLGGGPADWVARSLAGKPGLLVLDNAEHVEEAVRGIVDLLAAKCPRLRLLITSRAPLGLPTERVIAVEPFDPPDPGDDRARLVASPPVALYLDRISGGGGSFVPLDRDLQSIVAICAALGGLPMALELAAFRARREGVAATARAVARDAAGLRRIGRPGAARHAGLRALVSWGLDLLPEAYRSAYPMLSEFRSAWSAADAEAVCGESCPGGALDRMVSAGLLQVDRTGSEPLYSMPAALRAGGRGLLTEAERESVRAAHARWFLEAEGASVGRDRPASVALDLLAALEWAVVHRPEEAARSCLRLLDFWRGSRHAVRLLPLLARLSMETPTMPDRLCAELALMGVCIAEPAARYGEADLLNSRVLALGRRNGCADIEGAALVNEANCLCREGVRREALEPCRRGVDLLRSHGGLAPLVSSLSILAGLLLELGDRAEAAKVLSECCEIGDRLGDNWVVSDAVHNLAELAILRGALLEAEDLYARSVRLRLQVGDERHMDVALASVAGLAIMRRQYERGLVLHAAADAVRRLTGVARLPAIQRLCANEVRRAERRVDPEVARRCREHGKAMSIPEAAAYAISSAHSEAAIPPFSPAQMEVLRVAVRLGDCSDKAVAHAIGISVSTSKAHWRTILRMVGHHRRKEALAHAIAMGWLSPAADIDDPP